MIKLSNKWSYSLKAVIFIAESNNDLIRISDISVKEEISESLLRRIIADLEKAGILETVKWRNWWVKLAKSKTTISVYDILSAVWEELGLRDCTKWMYCDKKEDCSTTSLLSDIQKWFNSLLKIYSLDKFISKK